MAKYRLGLDVGTNSLGWSVIELDANGEPCAVLDAGARIFDSGRDPQSQGTLAATRTQKRQQRRQRARFKQRQTLLLRELTKAGLFPPTEDAEARLALQGKDPLELRARALTERLDPHEIGRALFHINQRRGFKSNRKDRSKETVSGKVANSIRLLMEQMGVKEQGLSKKDYMALSMEERREARQCERANRASALDELRAREQVTFGAFLYESRNRGGEERDKLPTRARSRKDEGLETEVYDLYPQREMLEDEFDKIWRAQGRHHPGLLTDEAKKRIRKAIFHQRPLKTPKRGLCAYMAEAGEKRTDKAMPSFQRYRIYQEVNNLEWPDQWGEIQRLRDHKKQRDQIAEMLERRHLTFKQIKTHLKKWGLAAGEFKLNFEGKQRKETKREGFDGNSASLVLQDPDCIGEGWHKWPPERQDACMELLLGDDPADDPASDGPTGDDRVMLALKERFGLDRSAAISCLENLHRLPEGTAHISLKAARLMLEKMRENCLQQPDAAEKVAEEVEEFHTHLRSKGELEDSLPYYGQAFLGTPHILPPDDEHDGSDDRSRYGRISNPTVHIALNQMRQVVNEIIRQRGRPASIAIELARDLPMGQEGRLEETRRQRELQKENEELDKKLEGLGQWKNPDNRLRLRLWKELDLDDPNGRCCPFTGQKIGIADLFNGKAEIEHLIPWSYSRDDSRANKVVCMREANREKGDRTPHEAFGDSPEWPYILARAQQLPPPKQWRFMPNAREMWQERHGDFLARQLNDTRYIGRIAREYLTRICDQHSINVLTGRHTAQLRHCWGLNGLLRGHNQQDASSPDSETPPRKSRDDHRHHAVDAIVAGMTTLSQLQKLSRSEDRLIAAPWGGFFKQVEDVVNGIQVSHRARRKVPGRRGATTGQLHNDSAYGILGDRGRDVGGAREVSIRSPIDWYIGQGGGEKRLKTILDEDLRGDFLAEFASGGADAAKRLADRRGIRRLKRTAKLTVFPIRHRGGQHKGQVYKGVKGDSNWAVEIYEIPAGQPKAGKWVGGAVPTHIANQRDFQPGVTCRPKEYPTARLVMRLFINDILSWDDDNGDPLLFRIQKASGQELALAPINEANVDGRNRDKEDNFQFVYKSIGALKKVGARKVHISPTGRVRAERRKTKLRTARD